jgi:hypothetical protein
MNDDWCIENDFAAQREMAEKGEDIIFKLRLDLLEQRLKNANLILEFGEYKAAMEWCFGEGCQMALDKYRKESIKTSLQ